MGIAIALTAIISAIVCIGGMIWGLICKVQVRLLKWVLLASPVVFIFGMNLFLKEKEQLLFFFVLFPPLAMWALLSYMKDRYNHSSPERMKEYMSSEKYKAGKAQRKTQEKAQQRKAAALAAKVVRVAILGTDSKNSTKSAIGRAVVGDFVAGGVGSIVGASTAKKTGMTKFLVEYADGHKAVETVKDNSARFQELIAFVDL